MVSELEVWLLISAAFLPLIAFLNNTLIIPAIQPYINLELSPLFIFILSAFQSLALPLAFYYEGPWGAGAKHRGENRQSKRLYVQGSIETNSRK
jgi:hypothetical protein